MEPISKDSISAHECVYDIIGEQDFINWTTCVLAHSEVKKALREIVEKTWKNYIAILPETERCHIDKFVECMKSNEIWHFGTDQKLSCDHHLCSRLHERFRHLYQAAEVKPIQHENIPCLPASDSCFQYNWNLAMMFAEIDHNLSESELVELDISNMLSLMSNCQLFAFDDSPKKYDNIFKDRDDLFHCMDNRITDERKNDILENVVDLLNIFDRPRFFVCQSVISSVKLLKKQNLQKDYQMYNVLVEMLLKVKLDVLMKDKCTCKSGILDEALTETEKILDQVKEINEEDANEVSELQAENDVLNEKIKKLEDKMLDLQSRVDNIVDIKYTYFLASTSESEKEFLLLHEMLPSALKERQKTDHDRQQEETLDSNPLTLNLDELASQFDNLRTLMNVHILASDLEWFEGIMERIGPYNSARSYYLRRILKDCCKRLVDCCHPIRSYPMEDLIIPLFSEGFRQHKKVVSVFLNRHVKKLTEDFDEAISKLIECFESLKSGLSGRKNEISESGRNRLQSYLETSAECVGKILFELEDTQHFVQSVRIDTDKIEILYEADVEEYYDEISEAFSNFEKKWRSLTSICKIYVESAERNKPTDVDQ